MCDIEFMNRNEKGIKIDKNLVDANVKLVDENKLLKHDIERAIQYIEEGNFDKETLLKILKGAVE